LIASSAVSRRFGLLGTFLQKRTQFPFAFPEKFAWLYESAGWRGSAPLRAAIPAVPMVFSERGTETDEGKK
jgi:hypothetical protein